MDTVLKAFMGIFLLLLLTAISVGLIGATIKADEADYFFSETAKKISVSHFSDEVIMECKDNAKEKGYQLTVKTFDVNGSGKKVGKGSLLYEFCVPILGIKKQYRIESNIW